MINVDVKKNQSENVTSMMRRFTKKVQSSGVLSRVRSLRYFSRIKSKNMQRRSALVRARRLAQRQELFKLGMLKETTRKGARR